MTIKRPLSEAEPAVDDEGQREGGVADANDDPGLREALNRGSRHGSTVYLWKERHLNKAIEYVVLGQDHPFSVD